MIASLIYNEIELRLPFVPFFDVNESYNDYEYTDINGNSYIINGKRKLRKIEFDSFISNNPINGYNPQATKDFTDIKNLVERHRKENQPIKFVVADNDITIISFDCIATLTYSNFDSAKDIKYHLTLNEFERVEI